MAKQKFRPTRLGGFSGVKTYISYVEVLKKRRNAGGRTFCDAIKLVRDKAFGFRQTGH
jgi:putative protease